MAIKLQILVLSLFMVAFHSCASWAQDASTKRARHHQAKAKAKDTGQNAKVKVDGSAVYQFPNFDSPVLEYMDRDKKVRISKKIYPGIGGLGAFYKIRIKKGVFGYIADTDVETGGKFTEEKPSRETEKDDDDYSEGESDDKATDDSGDPTKINKSMMEDDEPVAAKGSIYLTSYWGPALYSFHYAEGIANNTSSASVLLIGIKKTGPTEMIGGMPMDLDFVVTTRAPKYYDDIANSTSGFMFFANANILMPISEAKNYNFYYGFGPIIRYESWKVSLKQKPNKPAVDSQDMILGATVELGGAYRLKNNIVIRADGKYVYEREKYVGFGTSLQFKY